MLAPTIQQYGLGVQYEIFREAILDIAYVGSHGTHLFRPYNLNSPPPNTAVIDRQIHPNALRPFSGYGAITHRQSSASSIYHSLLRPSMLSTTFPSPASAEP